MFCIDPLSPYSLIIRVFNYSFVVLSVVGGAAGASLSRLSARGKALARIKAAKSPLAAAAARARKVLSIVRCKRGNVHDIKMNVYLHDYERGAAK